jgi:hypothetical protein
MLHRLHLSPALADACCVPPCRLRVHQESNINPNSDCGFIYGYYWWIFCLNFLAWCGARAYTPACLLIFCMFTSWLHA